MPIGYDLNELVSILKMYLEILSHKACIPYRMCIAGVADTTIGLTWGVVYVEAC